MELQKDLVKSLTIVKEEEYYRRACNDFMKLVENGHTKNGLHKLVKTSEEVLENQSSLSYLKRCYKIEELKQIFDYFQAGKCKNADPENVLAIRDLLKHLIDKYHTSFEFPSYEAKVELILDTIFVTGKKCKDFTEEEKNEIAELMVDCIKPIKSLIKTISYFSRTRLDCGILQKRSALQFLVDDYALFPVRDSILRNELDSADINESIKLLDDIIEEYHDMYDSSEGESDYESAGASQMPQSHVWWSK